MSDWVQHISKTGAKWELVPIEEVKPWWTVFDEDGRHRHLPTSDFIVCDPPAVWENVTAECEVEDEFGQLMHQHVARFTLTAWGDGYRLRKMMLFDHGLKWAFIVERKTP